MGLYTEFLESLPEVAKPVGDIMNATKVGSGKSLTIWPSPLNKDFKGSSYNETDKNSFVHFTSVNALISMLSEGFVHLGTLNHANDPQEILFGMSAFESLKENHIELSDQKDVFSLSMCDEEAINDLNLWRFYGGNGNGVAVHFRIENDSENWDRFHLSKVYYGDFNETGLYEYLNCLENSPYKHRLYPQVVPLLAFHKSRVYQSELEYRLLCHAPGGHLDRPNYPYWKGCHGLTFPTCTS